MPVIHLESFVDGGSSTAGDRFWFQVVRRVAEIRGTRTHVYLIRTSQREANGLGGIQILPTSQDLKLLLADMNATTRRAIQASVVLMEGLRFIGSITEMISSGGVEDFGQADDEEESGIRFASRVEDIMQSLSRMRMGGLETNDRSWSTCMEEFSKQRGDNNEPASGSDPRLPGGGAPEYPVKLTCHVFGRVVHQDLAA